MRRQVSLTGVGDPVQCLIAAKKCTVLFSITENTNLVGSKVRGMVCCMQNLGNVRKCLADISMTLFQNPQILDEL